MNELRNWQIQKLHAATTRWAYRDRNFIPSLREQEDLNKAAEEVIKLAKELVEAEDGSI